MRLSLTGVAKEVARSVSVSQLIHPQGFETLLECLRLILGGSRSKIGHDAYGALLTL